MADSDSSSFRGQRAAILLLVALALLVAGTGLWQVQTLRDRLREDVLDDNLTSARIAGKSLVSDMQGRLTLVDAVAGRGELARAVERGAWNETIPHLQDIVGLDPNVESAGILDTDGDLAARVPPAAIVGENFAFRDYFQTVMDTKRPYLSEVFRLAAPPHTIVVACAAPILGDDGVVVGVLRTTYPISTLALLEERVPIPNEGTLEIFDHNGHAVTGPLAGTERVFSSNPVVRRVLAGESGSGQLVPPAFDDERLVAYAPVKGIGWGVVVEQPTSAADAGIVGAIATRTWLVALLVIAGTFAVARLYAAMTRERNVTAAVLASMAEGAVSVDADGRIVMINPAMARLAGWGQKEVVGRPHGDVFRFFDVQGEPLPPEGGAIARTLADGEVVVGRGYGTTLETRAGWRVPVNVAAAPIRGFDGNLLGAVGIVRDVSYEREVDQLKSSLISTVSHELRTPLTMIQGFSELLLRKDMSPDDSKTAVEQINSAAQRLSRLIDDLLSVSRIESGRLVIRVAPVVLREVVDEVISTVPGVKERELRVDVDPELPRVIADRDKLIQILTNLVSNAVKYSPNGGPISIAARPIDSSVEVAVADQGLGMSEEDAQKLFEKFFRVDRPEVTTAGGTGLGLFIAKSLVELQGGRMWVDTRLGEGSTFSFSLPIAADTDERKAS